MKKRDIIIVVVCVAAALVCIGLTFWGNLKNNGVLTTDAFMGVIATMIGICATVIVGFQIASFVKIQETEKQIKEVKSERDKMLSERDALRNEIKFVETELSNAFVILSSTIKNKSVRIFSKILSVTCSDAINSPKTLFQRYKSLHDELCNASESDMKNPARFVSKLNSMKIPSDIENYREIMKLHLAVIEILEKVNETNESK